MNFHPAGRRLDPRAKRTWFTPVGLASCLLVACSPISSTHQTLTPAAGSSRKPVVFPDTISDPLEPLNRGIWEVNRGILTSVLQPTSRVYRTVVPTEARKSINHFSRNATYPGRLINNVLQGRWQGAGDESVRFLTNTTVGIGGFFDVASKWNIPKSEADFGQTFHRWGWHPNNFIMLPFLGPSDDLNATGSLADRAASPWTYVDFPYSLGSPAGTYNRLSDRTEATAQFIKAEADPYVGSKYIWTYASRHDAPDWQTSGPVDASTLETLAVAMIQTKDPRFIEKGRQRSVLLPSTGKRMKYNLWLQPETSPLVIVSPGLGSHRVSNATLSLAEALYNDGFSVVTIAGVFHPEFMENASTQALPAYPPNDCRDLHVFITEIDRTLAKKYPGRFGKKALVGFSMGGFQALHLAATEKSTDPSLMRFDRYVSINNPVDLHYGDQVIDNLSNAANAWPAATRQARANNAVHKAARLFTLPPEKLARPPFDATESKYLVGSSFRLTLRDTIFSSQERHDMGVLTTPISRWNRDAVYREIYTFSLRDYFLEFALPYYEKRGITAADFKRENTLETYTRALRSHKNTRVIVNSNDFLLSASDVSWLRSTFGSSRLTVFPSGGHIGNLASPQVQGRLLEYVSDLK
jgi:ABC-type transporter lipoprotein component MlaA/pimeloyl-ACP methyl ester carboxylesterase